jgi:glycosyltransferase involved in cell wall biosynthesis
VKAYARKIGIYEHCIFFGGVPYNEISKLYLVSDVVYAEAEPTLNQVMLPSGKIFEAMLCKKPVITCHIGEKTKLVNEAKCGLTVKPEAEEIARAFLMLAKDARRRQRMGINGYNFYLKNYSWEKYSTIFLSTYEKLLSPESMK